MAEPVEVAIYKALAEHLEALSFSPSVIPIAFPSMPFTPPVESSAVPIKWLRVHHLPAPTAALSVDHSGANEYLGIMQVDVVHSAKFGEGPPARIASQVINHFTRGTVLTADGYVVRIDKPPFRSATRQDDPWIFIPVTIPWRSFADNPA